MKLEAKHYRAILLLASNKSIKQVAKEMGCTEILIGKWKTDSDFRDALQQAHSRIYSDALNKLGNTALKAVDRLEEIIDDPETPVGYKLRAIDICLTHGEKIRNYQLESRLEKLEQLTLNEIPEVNLLNGNIN